MCRLEARTTNWFSRDKGRISVAGLWSGHPGCTSRRSNHAFWRPAPLFDTANTWSESAWRICGAAILAAHLVDRRIENRKSKIQPSHPRRSGRGAVQAGSPHHKLVQPRQRANQRGGFVVRPSWLHISTIESCFLEAPTTVWHRQHVGRISVAGLWCGHLGCTSRRFSESKIENPPEM